MSGYGQGGYGEGGYGGDAVHPGTTLLFANNVLETGALTSSPTTPLLERLKDRDRGPQWSGAGTGTHDIRVALPFGITVNAIALVNHNVMVSIEVAGSDTEAFGAPFATALVTEDPFLLTFGSPVTFKRFNIRIPIGGPEPRIGELFLGVPQVLRSPTAGVSGRAIAGNVVRDESPAGYTWSVKRGASRVRFDYAWNAITVATDQVALDTSYAESAEGSKKIVVRDPFGVARWMEITDAELAGDTLSGVLNSARLTLVEAL